MYRLSCQHNVRCMMMMMMTMVYAEYLMRVFPRMLFVIMKIDGETENKLDVNKLMDYVLSR